MRRFLPPSIRSRRLLGAFLAIALVGTGTVAAAAVVDTPDTPPIGDDIELDGVVDIGPRLPGRSLQAPTVIDPLNLVPGDEVVSP